MLSCPLRGERHPCRRRCAQGARKPRIHVFIATSSVHRSAKLNMTKEQVLEAAVRSVRLARSLCDDIQFSCEDVTRTEPDFLYQVYRAVVEAGATTLNIPIRSATLP